MMRRLYRLPPHHPLQLVLGLSLWALWLVLVYGGLSLACAFAPPAIDAGPWNSVNGTLLLLSLLTLLWMLRAAWRCWVVWRGLPRASHASATSVDAGPAAGRQRFTAACGLALHLLAAVSTAVVALPLLLLPTCL